MKEKIRKWIFNKLNIKNKIKITQELKKNKNQSTLTFKNSDSGHELKTIPIEGKL